MQAADFDHVGHQRPGLGQTVVYVGQHERGVPAHDVRHGRRTGPEVPPDQLGGRAVGERVVADRAEVHGQRVDQPLDERHAAAVVRQQVVDQVRRVLRVGHAPVELRRIVGCADGHQGRAVHVSERGETVGGERLGEHHVELRRPALPPANQRPDPRVFERGLAHPVVHAAQVPEPGHRVHRLEVVRNVQRADDRRQRVRHVHVHVTAVVVRGVDITAFAVPRERAYHGHVVAPFEQRGHQPFDHHEVAVTVVREHGQNVCRVALRKRTRQQSRHQTGRHTRCRHPILVARIEFQVSVKIDKHLSVTESAFSSNDYTFIRLKDVKGNFVLTNNNKSC